MKPAVLLQGVSREFGNDEVLHKISFDLPKKGMFGILGESGSGKSTLLNILSGLDTSYRGEVEILGKNWKKMSEKERNEFRLRSIGYLFQSFNLLELETALTNVLIPLDAVSLNGERTKRRRAVDLLSYVNLKGKEKQNVGTMSGGEKQRVALARALINDPRILLCDEPTGALDEKSGKMVFELLKKISKDRLVIVVSHDQKLITQYVDSILYLKNGRIHVEERTTNPLEKEEILAAGSRVRKKKSSLGFFFLLRHAFHLLKAKKKRSLLSISMIAIGLLGLGLSLYVSNSIEEEIGGAFDSLVDKKQIIMSPLQESGEPLSHVYASSKKDVLKIADAFKDKVLGVGTTYLASFESVFKDANYVSISNGRNKIILSSFSIRTAADYLWLEEYPDLKCYPHRPKVMENDSIVLGLPYSDMFGLCFDLHILRNYESLGNYIINNNGLQAVFSLAHEDWGYRDEQTFNVVAVAPSNAPTIYHLSHDWSTFLFEESMRFPAVDTEEIPSDKPWTLRKVHFLASKNGMTDLLSSIREKEGYENYVFERATSQFNLTVCEVGRSCDLNRAYVFEADKTSVPYSKIKEVAGEKCIDGYSIITNGSYTAYGGSLLIGFAKRFFFAKELTSLEPVIDSYSYVKAEEASLEFSLPPEVLDGYCLKSGEESLHMSSNFSNLKEGRLPSSVEEICISSSLKKKLDLGDEAIVAAEISSSLVGSYLSREFRTAKLKIVGVVDEEKPTFYVNGDWSIDFFRDILGMDSFELEPMGAILYLQNEEEAKAAIDLLSAKYQDYSFSSPYLSIFSSISETVSYISGILLCFSFIALIVSSLLYVVVLMVSIMENESEASLLYVMGISRIDIFKSYLAQAFLFSFGAFLFSSISILGLEVGVHFYIGSSFGSSSPFAFSFTPISAMAAFSIIVFLISGITLLVFALKKRFNRS